MRARCLQLTLKKYLSGLDVAQDWDGNVPEIWRWQHPSSACTGAMGEGMLGISC